MRILRIRHLTLAVRNIDAARLAFETLFGAEAAAAIAEIEAFSARTQELRFGDSAIELASPVDRDGALQRFIERRGEGVYTVALEVDDMDAAVAELAAKGIRVSDPVDSQPGVRSAFVTASATHGMSVQLVEVVGGRAEERGAPMATANSPEQTSTSDAAAGGEVPKALDLTPDEWSDVD